MGGVLPFASIFIEVYFLFTSFWHYKVRGIRVTKNIVGYDDISMNRTRVSDFLWRESCTSHWVIVLLDLFKRQVSLATDDVCKLQYYYVYGFLLLELVILAMITVCVSIVSTFFLLSTEDYRWWGNTYTSPWLCPQSNRTLFQAMECFLRICLNSRLCIFVFCFLLPAAYNDDGNIADCTLLWLHVCFLSLPWIVVWWNRVLGFFAICPPHLQYCQNRINCNWTITEEEIQVYASLALFPYWL